MGTKLPTRTMSLHIRIHQMYTSSANQIYFNVQLVVFINIIIHSRYGPSSFISYPNLASSVGNAFEIDALIRQFSDLLALYVISEDLAISDVVGVVFL